ncbi:alfa-L-rhamnosidase [Bacillus sp. TS-2]|nr:alfa-L-rhamnosidase [Bacillus sp. TS-2]
MNIQKAENRTIKLNEEFYEIANHHAPALYKEQHVPQEIVTIKKDDDFIHGCKVSEKQNVDTIEKSDYGKGDTFILDFGDHEVGYFSFKVLPIGSPPDAPLHLRLTFGEMPIEIFEDFSNYDGWISSSWLQQETLYVDILPQEIRLPRRYSFRYVKFEILDTSPKYRVAFNNIKCEYVSSANQSKIEFIDFQDSELMDLDRISIKTLRDCMQDVFEDGPKRDRRLWLGDLRLQALANYDTFKNYELVKRCLYLFAAVPDEKGRIAANLFLKPTLIADDTYLFDYSLFFTTTLYDYYQETKDQKTLCDLWPLAYRQLEIALERLNADGLIEDDSSWWSFIDWNEELNKQAPSQAVLIYALKKGLALANVVDIEKIEMLKNNLNVVENAAKKHLWDQSQGLFISGESRQISWATQVWMILAEVLNHDESQKLMKNLLRENPKIQMNTPYMYHHFTEALFKLGMKREGISTLKKYWGGMVLHGADTFWELYNPDDLNYSPYGSHIINSYCHAWSCTPTYLIRQYLL